MNDGYTVYSNEIVEIMDKLNCNKITFTSDGEIYADDTEIDFFSMLCEIRRKSS